ncbi:MAG TPA: lanthionine synthetase LanC family protein [Longimicrobium sp.]
MPVTDALVLPPDLKLVPVHALLPAVRETLEWEPGDVALGRAGARTPPKIVDADTAELLGEFRTPTRITDAVIRYSRRHGHDPEQVLEEVYPLLARLLGSRLLAEAGSREAGRIEPCHAPGDRAAGCEVVRAVQVLEDVELYQARRDGHPVALKALRPGRHPVSAAMLTREVAVLRRLDGGVAPRLVDEGEVEGRPWLVMEWIAGVDAFAAASELRASRVPGARLRLLELALAVADAYSALHAAGVLHCDVHARNLLVTGAGAVRVVDFGIARFLDAESGHGELRGGVSQFFEPEYARAVLEGRYPPPATPESEQYALGALLYLLLAGAHYADFSPEQAASLAQIRDQAPLPFSRRGVVSWPAVEAALARALEKDPARRFASVAVFADALRAAAGAEALAAAPARSSTRGEGALERMAAGVLARLGPEGTMVETGVPVAPVASVKFGAAGIAYGLLRMSMARDDAELLAWADLWAERALGDAGRPDAFVSPELEVTETVVGETTPFHTVTGVHLVRSVVGHALGHVAARDASAAEFVRLSGAPCDTLDLTLGRAGTLLGCALLVEHLGMRRARTPVHALGEAALEAIWTATTGFGAAGTTDEMEHLGAAHGWAGLLYATLRWCRATGAALPAPTERRLAELAAHAEPIGRGARWRWLRHPAPGVPNYMAGWCNGSAGLVPLWTLAHETFREPRWLEVAAAAAWNAWEEPGGISSLCCGYAGRAYALLNLYRHTGDGAWLARAAELGERAALAWGPHAESPDSLYKGQVGLAVLAADLERPDDSYMPFYEGPPV